MPVSSHFPWQRYWVPHGNGPTMHGGYFVAPTANRLDWFSPVSNGVALTTIQQVPLLVLLGDVGMGKSTTVRDEARAFQQQVAGTNHGVIYRDLKRLSEAQVLSQVFEHPEFVRWVRGEQALTLFLDSLDECWRRFDELESVLVGEMEKRFAQRSDKQPKLFIRLTCRSAEWRKETGHALQSLLSSVYNKEGAPAQEILRTYGLAPLSRENIQQAATCYGLNGEELLERIAEKEAQPLAAHPITLEMLLAIYAERNDFPSTRRELFDQACERLSVELHAQPGSASGRTTTARQRTAIAERLAAASVFTNRNLLNVDSERPIKRTDVLETADVFGFYDERFAGERVQVDQATTTEALQSGLFTASGDALQQFRHPAYGDFLGARYLSRPAIPLNQLIGLLTDTSDNSLRLFPQLEEAASWLADLRPELFEHLLRGNADVFLRCEPKQLSDPQRFVLVDSFLDLIRRHEAVEVDWQLKHRFRRLNHPHLATQLQKVISDKAEHPLVRETAVDIANYCERRDLALAIAGVFLDPTDVFRLRKHAGLALDDISDDTLRASLKQRATTEVLEDSYDDLKGSMLRLLWPSHLHISELLALLTPPKRRSYHGSYRNFIEYGLPQSISASDLPALLRWCRETQVSFDTLGAYG